MTSFKDKVLLVLSARRGGFKTNRRRLLLKADRCSLKGGDKNRFTIIEHMFYYYPAGGKKMGEETKKKAGAQACNKNARKYGFYMKVMDEEERKNFKLATEVEGLDSEIALMRVKIQSLIAHDPENLQMITKAVTALARVIMRKYNISKPDQKTFAEAMQNALKGIIIPAGVGVMQFLKK